MDQPPSSSVEFLEGLFEQYARDPGSVPPRWRKYFDSLTDGNGAGDVQTGPSFQPPGLFGPRSIPAGLPAGGEAVARPLAARTDAAGAARLQESVDRLVRNYRVRGHCIAQLDPLGRPRPPQPELEPEFFGFTPEDLATNVSATGVQGPDELPLGELIERLRTTYCRYIGAQFMHIDDLTVREWLQRRMEGSQNRVSLSRETQLRILTRLTDATIFEEFLRKKYVGSKTFSLEGGESLIPLLDLAIEEAGNQNVQEIVLGMAHRGRLNVLVNILGKSPRRIFREFEDLDPEKYRGGWDVKYHMGFSSDWKTRQGQNIHLSLAFNPSHLEFVNPVVLGRVRAKQDRFLDVARERAMPILIHGDAAIAGEGVVQETLNLTLLPAYFTGGTIHIVVNNQIGFTTPPDEGRSSMYCTDVCKMLPIPIFHVNGEDPEAVAQVVRLAMDFRREFRRDVVIDMYCYRRWGHNEGDEPEFTQPQLYEAVQKRPSVRESYLEHLLTLDGVTREEADRIAELRRQRLERALEEARDVDLDHAISTLQGIWSAYHGGKETIEDDVKTGVPQEKLSDLLRKLANIPEGFHLHRKLKKGVARRLQMADGKLPLDWAAGEALAFATLAVEGHRVRMSGQDSERGTFSHRHALLHDAENGALYAPFQHLDPKQAPVKIFNSPLSEAGVLGFEYGYSLDYPEALVIWEAQFGDFVNAGQVIIDQFLASAEDKWRRLSGLTMLLPHGFEGQGPEHSSARLERFLMLAAEENLQVVVPTTPAQMFHSLRRQVVRRWRKPLIVLTPKSLLRHPRCVSQLDDLATGRFRRVEPETDESISHKPQRILLCAGKVYYDLLEEREERQRDDVAILRLEQLYPLAESRLDLALERYPSGTAVYWTQEEPENMGAWRFLRDRFGATLLDRFPLHLIARPPSASPATGSHSAHDLEQRELLARAIS